MRRGVSYAGLWLLAACSSSHSLPGDVSWSPPPPTGADVMSGWRPGDGPPPPPPDAPPLSDCDGGYRWSAERHSCVDVDDCAVDNGGCGADGFIDCLDKPGGGVDCVDIDECTVADLCRGYDCLNVHAAAPICDLSCPLGSLDPRGDGSLCLQRVRQLGGSINVGYALLESGEPVMLKGRPERGTFPLPHDYIQIDGYGGDLCGLRADGHIECISARHEEAPANLGSGFRQIAVSLGFVCGLPDEGALRCHGSFSGLGPPRPEHAAAHFSQIDSSTYSICGVRDDGTAYCWGSDRSGALAQVNAEASSDFAQISLGSSHVCALRTDGSMHCWGDQSDPPGDDRVAGPNADNGTDYIQVSAGRAHSCGLHANGSVSCWGMQLSDEVAGPASDEHPPFVRIDAMDRVTCGFSESGAWTCWGDDLASGLWLLRPSQAPRAHGAAGGGCLQREDGSLLCTAASSDRWLEGHQAMNANGGTDYKAATIMSLGVCGLRQGGSVQCWPDAAANVGTSLDELMAQPDNRDFVELVSTRYAACGLRANGELRCLVPSDEVRQDLHALQINADGGRFVDVAGEWLSQLCAVRDSGQIACWGSTPDSEQVAGPNASSFSDYTSVSVSSAATCALRQGGQVQCWAQDTRALALGLEPRQDFIQVASSGTHTCGVRADGSLVCRGSDSSGQVSGPNGSARADYVFVSTTAVGTCALRGDGVQQCWGQLVSDSGALIVASRDLQLP